VCGGRRLTGSAGTETGGEAVVRALDAYLAEFPATAGRHRVGSDADGHPAPLGVEATGEEGRSWW
jgi:hypothetical protein